MTFRFTHSDYFTDKLEGKVLIGIYRKACDELLESKQIDANFFNEIYSINKCSIMSVLSYNNGDLEDVNYCEHEAYIRCFSINNDSEYMWKTYAKEKGFVIGLYKGLFGKDFFKNYFADKYSGIHVLSGKVIYNEHEQVELIKKYLLKLYNVYIKSPDVLPEVKSFISETFMQTLSYFYKASKFYKEEEYRVIIYRPNVEEVGYLPNIEYSPYGKYLKIRIDRELCQGTAYKLYLNTDYTESEAYFIRDSFRRQYNMYIYFTHNEKRFEYTILD